MNFISKLESILSYQPTELTVYTAIYVIIAVVVAAVGMQLNLAGTRRLAEQIVRASLESPERPFTVSFSPDIPALADARRADAWVRTRPVAEVLFYNPSSQRWQAQGLAYGVGTAFINGALVAFRAVPTGADAALVAELQAIAETKEIPAPLLARLALMDPNEVFSLIEACGLVRPFNTALEKLSDAELPHPLSSAFGRLIDLD